MIVSPYSAVLSLFWFTFFITFADIFRRKTGFLSHYNIFGLLALVFLGVARLFLPIELPFTMIIRSDKAVSNVVAFFTYPFLTIDRVEISLILLLLLVWIAGFLYRLILFLKRLYHDRSQLKGISYKQNHHAERLMSEVALKMRLSKRHRLMVTPDISEPLLVGLIRPTILVPDIDFNDDIMTTILSHEGQHIRSNDQYIKLIVNILAAIMWWLPSSQRMRDHIDDALELRCDAVLTRNMNKQEKMGYLETILFVYNRVVDAELDVSLSSRFASQKRDILQERFEAILKHGKSSQKFIKIFSMIFLLAFVLSFCVIVQPYYNPPNIEGEIIIDSSNSYIVYSDGSYRLYYNHTFLFEIPDDEITDEPFCNLPIIEE